MAECSSHLYIRVSRVNAAHVLACVYIFPLFGQPDLTGLQDSAAL